MRAVMLEVDQRLIAERHRLGLDKRDEMWDGVLHIVPPASRIHQKIEARLLVALSPVASRKGWDIQAETGVFAANDDYKVPDLAVFDANVASDRGIERSAILVIEIRSPGDETTEKIPWYLAHGSAAVFVIDRDSLRLELHTPDGVLRPDSDGRLQVPVLDVQIGSEGSTLLVAGDRIDI